MGYPTGVSQHIWSATASEPITTSLLRSNVTNPVWMLSSPAMFIGAWQGAGAQVGNNTNQLITLNAEILDTNEGHSDAANASRYYVPVSGWYLCRGACTFVAAASNNTFSFASGIDCFQSATKTFYKGGQHCGSSGIRVIANSAELLQASTASPITNADYIELYGFQNTGAAVNIDVSAADGVFPYLMTRWIATPTGTVGLPVPSNVAFADTTAISGAFMNANVRDAVNFLTFPPMARMSNLGSTAQSIPSQTFPAGTAINWGTTSLPAGSGVNSDNYGGWSAGTPSVYTFPRAGRYYVYGQVAFVSTSAGTSRAAGLGVNANPIQWGQRCFDSGSGGTGTTVIAEQYIRASAGDTVQLFGSQNTGSSLNLVTSGAGYCKMIVVWEGS